MNDFVHNDPEFKDLLAIVASKEGVDVTLVEKDYWIMHVLYSLMHQNIEFELKGGTSLSKGFRLIHRFSEDIDIHIRTNYELSTEGNEDKLEVRTARKEFYDLLAKTLIINGINQIHRDHEFDDQKYRSGGIRLHYRSLTPALHGVKDGILLEVGFDTVTPNVPIDIRSWVWDHLVSINASGNYINNTASGVACYHPGYTLVEKLQTIVRKYRNKDKPGASDATNFMRQYYDVYCLLSSPEIQSFIGSAEYFAHKKARIKGADNEIRLNEHPALFLPNPEVRSVFKSRYEATASLYYLGQPSFDEVCSRIQDFAHQF
jgi:hypothetical protein